MYAAPKVGKEVGKRTDQDGAGNHKLTDRTIKAAKNSGRISDGGGLYLRVNPSVTGVSRSWSFMWTRDGDRKEIGLGPYPEITLSDARETAGAYRALVAKGGNPAVDRAKETEPTFGKCADDYIESNGTGLEQPEAPAAVATDAWRRILQGNPRQACFGRHPCRRAGNPETDMAGKDVTASRLRGRIERVLNYAKAHGWRSGENPALWRGNLDNILPKRDKRKAVNHLAAMSYRDVPAFMDRSTPARAIAAARWNFLILTASRTGEV